MDNLRYKRRVSQFPTGGGHGRGAACRNELPGNYPNGPGVGEQCGCAHWRERRGLRNFFYSSFAVGWSGPGRNLGGGRVDMITGQATDDGLRKFYLMQLEFRLASNGLFFPDIWDKILQTETRVLKEICDSEFEREVFERVRPRTL